MIELIEVVFGSIVPRSGMGSKRFWVDRTLIPDLLRKYADSGAIGDVFLQFVDFPGFWCNPFDPLAILRGFAISSQFNWIVEIAVKIAAPMFWSQS